MKKKMSAEVVIDTLRVQVYMNDKLWNLDFYPNS